MSNKKTKCEECGNECAAWALNTYGVCAACVGKGYSRAGFSPSDYEWLTRGSNVESLIGKPINLRDYFKPYKPLDG